MSIMQEQLEAALPGWGWACEDDPEIVRGQMGELVAMVVRYEPRFGGHYYACVDTKSDQMLANVEHVSFVEAATEAIKAAKQLLNKRWEEELKTAKQLLAMAERRFGFAQEELLFAQKQMDDAQVKLDLLGSEES